MKELSLRDERELDRLFESAEKYTGLNIDAYLGSLEFLVNNFEGRGYDMRKYRKWLSEIRESYRQVAESHTESQGAITWGTTDT